MCPSCIYRHGTHSYIMLCTCPLENNALSVLHYVVKVTRHYLMLHRFEMHSGLELSRTALFRAATSQPCVFARLLVGKNIFKIGKYFISSHCDAVSYVSCRFVQFLEDRFCA